MLFLQNGIVRQAHRNRGEGEYSLDRRRLYYGRCRRFSAWDESEKENNVRSPLLEAELSKAEVREISKHLNLPTWDKPSFACLSSRFPYGFGITKENLTKVDRAERILRDAGFKYYRVRHHDDKTARIEVGAEELPRLLDDAFRLSLVAQLKGLGFTYVTLDLQGYRTGSMNEVLSREAKESFTK